MTPRERVRAAPSHAEPDRVQVDNNGFVSSIHEVAYANLLRHLGRTEDVATPVLRGDPDDPVQEADGGGIIILSVIVSKIIEARLMGAGC
jgi:hypothetical protein